MLKNIQSDDSVPYYSNDKSNITEKPWKEHYN
jgi:hypothetical protein